MRKYELIKSDEYVYTNGQRVSLYRIQALRNFGDVKVGDIGGFIETESNLSHYGDCWIYDSVASFRNSQVFDNAKIYGYSYVYGNAKVYGNSIIKGLVSVCKESKVCGNAIVTGNIHICIDVILDHGYWEIVVRGKQRYLISNTLEMVKL